MRYRVRLERQVVDFVNARLPEFRRRVKEAFKGLATWEGDICPLRDELEGYYRLRVDRYRFLFAVTKQIEVVYAGPRTTAYEAFESMVASGDLTDPPL